MAARIHPTAEVADSISIGDDTIVWHNTQIREDVVIGDECKIGRGVYIDTGVRIGNRVKIQNNVSIYKGVVLEDGVFIGPHVCFTNDLRPRAISPGGALKIVDDWVISQTIVRHGASIGANTTVVCGVTIENWAMVGAGSVVTRDIPAFGLVWGNPARLKGFVCPCGARLRALQFAVGCPPGAVEMVCQECQSTVVMPKSVYYLKSTYDTHF